MAKLKKQFRKAAGRVLRHKIVQDVIEDLITAAILAAAARFSQSKIATKAVRRTRGLVERGGETKAGKRNATARKTASRGR